MITCAPVPGRAQAVGEWQIQSEPDGYCAVSTGHLPEETAANFQGLDFFVPGTVPDRIFVMLNISAEQREALGLTEPGTPITLHLTFINPDHGNGAIILGAEIMTESAPVGAGKLISRLDATELEYFRKYQKLVVYVASSQEKLQTISLVNSRAALANLATCVGKTLKIH